jgi:hypothetical protein
MVLATGVVACGTTYVPEWPPPAGSSPAFQEGYADGCFSGSQEATLDPYPFVRKDAERFRNDAEYREGWQRGHRICYQRNLDRLHSLDFGLEGK